MKYFSFYKEVLACKTDEEVFSYFISTLKPSNRIWSYFVNWEKVLGNTRKIEVALNVFNYLIGKKDFDKEFKFLLKENPGISKMIPALVVRDGLNTKKFKILVDYKGKRLVYEDYDFDRGRLTDNDIAKCLTFVKETGFKDLLVSGRIKNLVDYMIGVEAGLDSNGRKNRSGHVMESIVAVFVEDLCNKRGFRYIKEGDARKIKSVFGRTVPVDRSSRRYDFVVDNKRELFIVETNFYGGGGSKLKSTAGEYRNLFDVLKGRYKFIWITDGFGWESTARPLRETFDHIDYLFNLDMLEKGIMEYLLTKG